MPMGKECIAIELTFTSLFDSKYLFRVMDVGFLMKMRLFFLVDSQLKEFQSITELVGFPIFQI